MKTWLFYAGTVFLFMSAPARAFQETKPVVKAEDPAAKEQAERQKQLMEINKIQDPAKKRALLEQYIRENPNASNLSSARSSLLSLLAKEDPVKAVELADEILSKPVDPKVPWAQKNAYLYKFLAYQNQKNDEAIKRLGQQILETQSDPYVLQQAAQFDKEHKLKLLDKALVERAKKESKDEFPTLSNLHADYARALNQSGEKAKAVESMSKAIELVNKDLAEFAALPEKDPKRRRADSLRSSLSYQYQTMAQFLSDAGEHQRGLDYLAKAEESLGDGGLEQRSSLESARGKLHEGLGNTEKALGSYVRSFAFRMDPKTRYKIKTLAEKTGKSADALYAQARETRLAQALPFKPFELKTVEGESKTFQDLRSKVTLVNLFFPT